MALARKILAIIHHLLTNMEPYEEPGVKKRVRHQKVLKCDEFGISGAFEIIGKREYDTRKFSNATSSEFRERSRSSVRLKIRLVQREAAAVDQGNLIYDFSTCI